MYETIINIAILYWVSGINNVERKRKEKYKSLYSDQFNKKKKKMSIIQCT